MASSPLLTFYWYGFINSCSSQWLLVNFCPQLFWCSNCLRWANRSISRLALVSFWHVFIILWAHLSSSKHTYMYQFSWVTPSCLSLCNVHRVSDAIQPSHPLSSPFPPAFNLSQHQGLLQWVSSSHQVANIYTLYIYSVWIHTQF